MPLWEQPLLLLFFILQTIGNDVDIKHPLLRLIRMAEITDDAMGVVQPVH